MDDSIQKSRLDCIESSVIKSPSVRVSLRQKRLFKALRSNLIRRKSQAYGREDGDNGVSCPSLNSPLTPMQSS